MDYQLFEQLVEKKSVAPEEQTIGDILVPYLRAHGFTVTTQAVGPNRFNIFAERHKGDKAILFYGHMDTVAPVNLHLWRTNPYKLIQKRDRLYGLGAYDMKGGIVAFLAAAIASNAYVKIFLAVDEEADSLGAWTAVKKRPAFFSDVELVISVEPNFGAGMHSILRGRTGRFLYHVHFEGKPVHVARFSDGVDAIALLGEFVSDFYKNRKTLFLDRGSYAQIRAVNGSSVGMSVCGAALAEVEVLPRHDETIQTIKKRLESMTRARVQVKPRKTPYLQGYLFVQFPMMERIAEIIRTNLRQKMVLATRQSVADDNVLATLGVPVITWGPDGGSAHSPNEYVSKKSLEILSHMFLELLRTR